MIILPDLAQCPFTITAHKEAIQRAIERIQAVSPKSAHVQDKREG